MNTHKTAIWLTFAYGNDIKAMTKSIFIPRFLLTLTILVAALSAHAQPVKGMILSDSANLCVVRVWGTHFERGYAYGYLCAPKIKSIYEGYYKEFYGKYLKLAHAVLSAGLFMKIDHDYIDEAQGVMAGMESAGVVVESMDYIDLLTGNCLLDLLNGLSKINNSGMGCSSLMSWGKATMGTDLKGHACITRMLDWEIDPELISNQVMVAHIPSEPDEQPWIMIGFAGQIAALSGVNQHMGVFQHVLSNVSAGKVNQLHYEPIWFSLRKVLEKNDYNHDHKHNTRDMQDVLSANTKGYASSCIVCAMAKTSHKNSLTAEVAEVAPIPPYLTFRDSDFQDAIPGDNLYAANSEIKRNNHHYFCHRYHAVVTGLGEGDSISKHKQWSIMANYSVSENSMENIQMMQYIPEESLIRLSVHKHGRPAYLNKPDSWSVKGLLNYPAAAMATPGVHTLSLWTVNQPEYICVNILQKKTGDITLRVSDITGKQVRLERHPAAKAGSGSFKIPLNGLAPGVYLLQAETSTGNSYGKFVVR